MPCHRPPAATGLWKFSSTFSDRELSFFELNNVNFFLPFLLRTNQTIIAKHAKFAKFRPLHTHNAQVNTKLTSTTAKLISYYCCVCILLDLSNSFMLLAPVYIDTAFILTVFTFFLIVEYIFSNFKTSMIS